MKARIVTGLSIVLIATCVRARADDTPAQAAARAALEQEFSQLDHASAQDTNAVANASGSTAPAPDVSPVRSVPAKTPASIPSVASSESASTSVVPLDNTTAQTAALAALKQKMDELNAAANQPSSSTSAVAITVNIPAIAPPRDASAAATPITETPGAESPPAKTPAVSTAAAAPVAVVPAIAVPAPKVPTAPAAAAAYPANTAPDNGPVATATPRGAPPAAIGLPKSLPGQARPTNELVTISGKTYKNVEVERVASDGIFISYTPVQGGWATAKVPFEELPAELRTIYQK